MDALKQKYNEQIKSLVPISGLATQYQNEVVQQAEILNFKKKQHVFEQGDVDPYTYYLLDGELELEADGQLLKTVEGGSEDARSALSQLQPRQMSARSKGRAVLLRIARNVMDRLLTMADPGTSEGAVEVTEVEAGDDEGGGDWMTRMLQSELFSRIPPANIQRVFAVMESVQFKAGSVVVKQGSPGDYYYVIQTGRCQVTRRASASGKPIKLAELGGGDSFGEEALVSDAKRNATVTMLNDGELVRLTKDDFIELIKKPSLDSVEYEAAKVLVAEGACWLDVRFPEEHAKDGIETSVNVPLNQLRGELKNLDSDRIYVAYCDSGARSSAGAFLLAQNGFDVRYLEGGLIVSHGIEPTREAAEPEPENIAEGPKAVAEAPEPEPEPEKRAPAPAVTPTLESAQADVRAAELAEDVAKADTRMEEAMRLKAEAEAAKRAAAKKLRSRNKQLEETSAQAEAELEQKAAEANAALEEAKRQGVELEKARRAAEAEGAAKQKQEEERLIRLKAEAEAAKKAAATKLRSKNQELEQKAAKAKAILEQKASKANAALREAKRQRVDLEKARRAAGAEAEAKRKGEEERLMRLKSEAEAEKRAAAEKLRARNEELEQKAAKVKAELDKKAAEANAVLEEAKRQRVELEKARRTAEAEAEAMREQEEERLEKLKQESEARLDVERAKLEAEYARQAEELARLQELKDETKAEIQQEREALARTASAASRELEKAEKAKHEGDEVERRIREQSEAAIRAERERLEAEFARAAEQMSEAQREREMAEMIKEAAVEKAARTIAEEKVAQALAQKEEEAKLDAERQKLREEAKRLRETLEDAKKVKAQAQAKARADDEMRKKLKQQEAKLARDMNAAADKVEPRRPATPSAREDELARANALLAAAEAAHRNAEEAKQDLEDTQSWKKSELDALREQMESELSDFMADNPTPRKDDEETKKRAAKMNIFTKRREATEKKRAEANDMILDEVASQLDK
ncbi:MAG: hypothetical protein BMS9Abin01_0568 [Gammaproteobacteria bacterium]|nr:MAG: hypothetical protein BMS9Abin01_0568 [Gammaproteobacteria bacterium]